MSVWAKYLEVDLFGKELLAGKSTKIEWVKPVYAEDVLTGKGVITRMEKRNAKNGIVEISIEKGRVGFDRCHRSHCKMQSGIKMSYGMLLWQHAVFGCIAIKMGRKLYILQIRQ
jgi:hypothetical protein